MSRMRGVFYLAIMNDSRWLKYLINEHKDFYNALGRQRNICLQQGIRIDVQGRYETPKQKYKVAINDGSWLIFHPRCKGGDRVHISNMKKNYRKCIRSYASFLRADGIDNVDEMLYYILHYTFHHISFYRGITITYNETKPIIDEVIKWIMKKDIEKVDKSKFIDPRKIAAPNEICNGAIRKATKSEKIRVVRKTQKILTDKEIAEKYNPNLTIEENCANIGIKPTRLKQWKRENADSIESIEDKVKRLYNPSLSWKKNAEIIGHSINTIKKYIKKEEAMDVDFITPELETADSENQFTECLDVDNNEIIGHSPDTTNEHIKKDFGTAELATKDSNTQFDIDDDKLIGWVMKYEFDEDVEQKNENADSVESIEDKVKQQEQIADDTETIVSETEVDNLFEGRLDIDSDEFWRWMWGDEILAEVERERERNARLYGTEDVVKMVV